MALAERGFRLATYAMWWIKASIQEYVLRSWSLVKMGTTASQKKLFFNLRRLKARMKAFESGDLAPEHVTAIATKLRVSEEEVVNMDRRLAGPDHSLNAPLRVDGEGEWQDFLADERENQEEVLIKSDLSGKRRSLLTCALKVLSDRERLILSARRLKEDAATLEELSQEHGISRERVRQIEVRAFEKLQKFIRAAVVNPSLCAC